MKCETPRDKCELCDSYSSCPEIGQLTKEYMEDERNNHRSIFSGSLNTKIKYRCSKCGTVGIDIFFDQYIHNVSPMDRDARCTCDQCYWEMDNKQPKRRIK